MSFRSASYEDLRGGLVPAYRQIANELRRIIVDHRLEPGTRLPLETELVVKFEVVCCSPDVWLLPRGLSRRAPVLNDANSHRVLAATSQNRC
ncbi:GntR family transcriptional regulator [Microbacterium sp. 20-116]|uniref:GntR family transcriptional regulator n=1 Tax=Microbacterium sp. 20-116 TaxID=3239883 RepID=UPI0034E2BAE1